MFFCEIEQYVIVICLRDFQNCLVYSSGNYTNFDVILLYYSNRYALLNLFFLKTCILKFVFYRISIVQLMYYMIYRCIIII